MAYNDLLKVYWITPLRTASRSCGPILQHFEFTLNDHDLKIPQEKIHYYHICNVRNPYSRLVSLYKLFVHNRKHLNINFEDWIDGVFNNVFESYDNQVELNLLLSKPIDRIVRLEFLEGDLKEIYFIKENFENLTEIFERNIKTNEYLGEFEEFDDREWYSFYNQNMADKVFKKLEKQFELFNYNRNYWKDGTP